MPAAHSPLWTDAEKGWALVQKFGPQTASQKTISDSAAFAAILSFDYEHHQSGKIVEHPEARREVAEKTGAQVAKYVEGREADDTIDIKKATEEAKHLSHLLYDDYYGRCQNYNPLGQVPYPSVEQALETYSP